MDFKDELPVLRENGKQNTYCTDSTFFYYYEYFILEKTKEEKKQRFVQQKN